MARPIPVLPDVPSIIVPPGFSRPCFSASSIILTAMRSLIELPGLKVSSFATTSAGTAPRVMRLMRTIGVCPIASRMEEAIFGMTLVVSAFRRTRRGPAKAGHYIWILFPIIEAALNARADRFDRLRLTDEQVFGE